MLERSLVETPASRSNARRSERSFGSESSIKSSIPTAYWSFCKLLQQEKLRFARLLQSPLPDSNRRPPPYHGGSRIRAQFVEARQLGRGSRHGQTMRGNGAAAQAYSRGTSRAAGQVLVKHLASAGIAEIQRYLHEVVRSTRTGTGPRDGPRPNSVNAWRACIRCTLSGRLAASKEVAPKPKPAISLARARP